MKYWIEELVEQDGGNTWTLVAKANSLDVAKQIASMGETVRRITTQVITVVYQSVG